MEQKKLYKWLLVVALFMLFSCSEQLENTNETLIRKNDVVSSVTEGRMIFFDSESLRQKVEKIKTLDFDEKADYMAAYYDKGFVSMSFCERR